MRFYGITLILCTTIAHMLLLNVLPSQLDIGKCLSTNCRNFLAKLVEALWLNGGSKSSIGTSYGLIHHSAVISRFIVVF